MMYQPDQKKKHYYIKSKTPPNTYQTHQTHQQHSQQHHQTLQHHALIKDRIKLDISREKQNKQFKDYKNKTVVEDRGLTFGGVKGDKRPLIIHKNNRENQDKNNVKEKPKEKSSLIDRKDKGKSNPLIKTPLQTFKTEDLLSTMICHEELEFKPVEKKSLIPKKEYIAKEYTAKEYNPKEYVGKQHQAQKTTSKFDHPKQQQTKKCSTSSITKQLQAFQTLSKQINTTAQTQALNQVIMRQQQYSVNPDYLQNNQKQINWWTRAVLINWMRQICFQLALMRDTYHIAVVLLDNYVARVANVPKSMFQAIGVTMLFIASKLEEFEPRRSDELAETTNKCCTARSILELQAKIVKTLKFRLNPPTIYTLSNRILIQWDNFISSPQVQYNPLLIQKKLYFKSLNEDSYRLFRTLMQYIDCSILDVQTYRYKPRTLVCGFMYLMLGIQYGCFDEAQICSNFPWGSQYLIDQSYFNQLYGEFVEYCFGFTLLDILPSIQYAATFFGLGLSFESPVIREQNNDLQAMSLEEYCSYQTHNGGMLRYLKGRERSI